MHWVLIDHNIRIEQNTISEVVHNQVKLGNQLLHCIYESEAVTNPSVKLFSIDRCGSLGLLLVIDRVVRTLMITSDD